jgi:oxalate decarboxylase/phosphoglucose isomerase-like protein (cupin superfamily)
MPEVTVIEKIDTKIWMEAQEVCRLYHKTERITFGMSELPPGGIGDLDKGHSEADEIFYCVQGEVLCYVPEEDTYHRLSAGDAMLVPPNKGHKLFNIGETRAILTWSCAPHQ